MVGTHFSARQAQLGQFKISALRDAAFALDGGAMFGVVPRQLWQKLTPVFDDNTIPCATTPFLIEDGENIIVVETGLGRRWNEKQQAMFHIDYSQGHCLAESLTEAGVNPEDVTHCLLSHAHWDHAGAACDVNGKPMFPNAEYWLSESELAATLVPDHMRRASYRRDDIQPLIDAGLLHTFKDQQQVLPGVKMQLLGGHSEGLTLITFESEGQTAAFWTDFVPTRNHVHLPFIMAYDMDASHSYEIRKEYIPRAFDEQWLCMLYHDPVSPLGRFTFDGKKYGFAALKSDQQG
ncbi:MAG: glyoxylase-like metal-dependent hydrolase (beta-lactamase superfamily II) [Myxococcota bacterium]|jgi:glyoxylase-like metal-dependent hydrolase (beta-lactamase superfamily II)